MTIAQTLIQIINSEMKQLQEFGYTEIGRNQLYKRYKVSMCSFTRDMAEMKCKMRRSKGTYESFVYGDKSNKQPILFNIDSLVETTEKLIK